MHKRKKGRRRYRHLMAGMTGAMLLTAAMMNQHTPTAKAAPAWETLLPDSVNDALTKSKENIGDVLAKSKENIEERVKESIKDNINKKIEEKKVQWGQEILNKLSSPLVSRANKLIEDVQATAQMAGRGERMRLGSREHPAVVSADPTVIPNGAPLYVELADGNGMYAVADSASGAIEGKRLELSLSDRARAEQFGEQEVRVHVLSDDAMHLA